MEIGISRPSAVLKDFAVALTPPAKPAPQITPQITDPLFRSVQNAPAFGDMRLADVRRFDAAKLVLGSKSMAIWEAGSGAKQAGLSDAETQKLNDILTNSTSYQQDADVVRDALASKNPDRALRTFIDLDAKRKAAPDRITPDIVRTLTLGVGQARTSASEGRAGILGHDQALRAADALANMPQSQYDRIKGALDQAGGFPSVLVSDHQGQYLSKRPLADPQAERALILKAVAARHDELVKPDLWAQITMSRGNPLPATSQVLDFAKAIRGDGRSDLIERTSVLDLDGESDGVDDALQQRFSMSCGPAAVQIAHADADPVYAWQLHNSDTIHSTSTSGKIADYQKTMLENNGGRAVERGAAAGFGMWADAQFNDTVSPETGHSYTRRTVSDSIASRTTACDDIAKLVMNGVDVPIVAGWNSGGSHYLMITDVRGSGNFQEFLVTDPWNGKTDWVTRNSIVNGNTDFFAGTGRIIDYYN
jgi:hypothetical protein